MKKGINVTLLALMLTSPTLLLAQDLLDDVETLNNDHLELDELNINGQLTPAQRLEQTRKKLEERNRQMVDKKIEDIRVKQEIELTKKLQSAFNENLNAIDSVSNKQASTVAAQPVEAAPVVAPQPTIIERVIEVEPKKIEEEKLVRITPSFALSTFKGDVIDFEAKSSFGVATDYLVAPQFAVGFGVNYTTMDISDSTNSYVDYTGTNYGSYFPNGREISFSKLNLEANTRYFLTVDSKVKPYLGAGLGYNRTTMKYDGSSNGYSYNGINYGSEGVSSNYVSGSVKLGAEIDLSSSLALGVDLGYTKAITSGFGTKNETTNQNYDQQRLEKLSEAIEESDNLTFGAGVVLKF